MHLLNSHHSIALGVERYKKYVRKENIGRLKKSFFEKDFFLDVKYGQTNLNPNHKFWDTKWKKVYDSIEPKFDRKDFLIGDKYPYYYWFYNQIDKEFDRPKWIFILRDVRDVAMSYNARAADRKDRWTSDRDYTVAIADWNDSLEKTMAYLSKGSADLFVCEYDSIFSYNPDYLAAMLNFLEVDEVYPGIVDYYQNMTKDWEQRLQRKKRLPLEQEEAVLKQARWDLRDALLAKYGAKATA